ncbi:MAG TPA: hypothetical protein VM240_01305 [Verrucomicrobiae bacterium]|nr:hypothetical protein [Verrucomicrobiae bacterium]
MAPQPPPTIDDLGVRGSLYLGALLLGQGGRLPVAPTMRATLAVLDLLKEFGLIEVPWPEARWPVRPDAEETPIEQLQWRYAWGAYSRDALPEAIEEYLQSVPRDDYGLACRLKLWEELASAEAESFFEHQLVKHRFPADWARDLAFVQRQSPQNLSVSQWRYCVWAAVRHGGALAQQQYTPDPAVLREGIFVELRRRVSHVAGGQWGACSLPPFQRLPQSALGRVFVRHLTGPEFDFWSAAPSLTGLLFRRQARQEP